MGCLRASEKMNVSKKIVRFGLIERESFCPIVLAPLESLDRNVKSAVARATKYYQISVCIWNCSVVRDRG